jgi:DNA-binding NarL/FixJ family response regulator
MNSPVKTIKLMIAEDQAIILHSLMILLNSLENIEVIGTALNGVDLLTLLEKNKPDVILMDINMPKMNGIEATKIIDAKMPWVKVIALSMYDHPVYIKKMFKSGAKGFVSKNATKMELGKAIEMVYNGDIYISEEISRILLREYSNTTDSDDNADYTSLTSREIEIIQLLADGLYTKEIAEKLFISDKTVERHKTNILKKLKLRNTAQLVKVAITKGIIVS